MDNQALSYFNSKKELSQKQITWQNNLAKFNYKFEFKRGKDNPVADALSRLTMAVPTQVETTMDLKFRILFFDCTHFMSLRGPRLHIGNF